MGWSAQFLNRLKAKKITPIYKLRFLYIGAQGPFSGDVYISSKGSTVGNVKIVASSVNVQGTNVTPQTWQVGFGGFSLSIMGNISNIMPYLRRGSFAELKVSIGGPFETIAIGQLRTLRAEPPRYNLQFVDLLSALQSSTDVNVANTAYNVNLPLQKNIIMAGCGVETTLHTNYTAFDTRLYTNDLDLFQKETGQEGHVRIIDGGKDVVLGWTAKGANFLELHAISVRYPSTQNLVAMDVYDKSTTIVKPLAVLPGFPGDILGKILMSTGLGTNGPLDTYPLEFSVRAFFDNFTLDTQDIALQKQKIITLENQDPNYLWNIAIESQFVGGLRDFVTLAGKCGQWPVYRQNAISWRGCVDPYGGSLYNFVYPQAHILDKHINKINNHDFYNPQVSNIYRETTITYSLRTGQTIPDAVSSSGIISKAKSLPYLDRIVRDNTFTYTGSPYTSSGRAIRNKHADSDIGRMLGYDAFTTEKLSLNVDVEFSKLVAGDIITITSKYISGLSEAPGKTYNNRYGMITGVNYDLTLQKCNLEIAILPTKQYRNS